MDSFKIEQDITIDANSEKVFSKLTGNITAWWDHTRSENPKAVILEPKLNGLFYEDMGGGNGAIWGRVEHLEINRIISWKGSMGMGSAVLGVIKIELEEKENTTLLKLSHHAIGLIDSNASENYNTGWQHLLRDRFKPYVEGLSIK